MPYKEDRNYTIYEYACHEGNYSIANMLSAARSDERAAEREAAATLRDR
jgi:hypothetical protein